MRRLILVAGVAAFTVVALVAYAFWDAIEVAVFAPPPPPEPVVEMTALAEPREVATAAPAGDSGRALDAAALLHVPAPGDAPAAAITAPAEPGAVAMAAPVGDAGSALDAAAPEPVPAHGDAPVVAMMALAEPGAVAAAAPAGDAGSALETASPLRVPTPGDAPAAAMMALAEPGAVAAAAPAGSLGGALDAAAPEPVPAPGEVPAAAMTALAEPGAVAAAAPAGDGGSALDAAAPEPVLAPSEVPAAAMTVPTTRPAPDAPVAAPTEIASALPPAQEAPGAAAPEPTRAPPPARPAERPQVVETPPDMTRPTVGIVRVAPDGVTMFAGRAEPGAKISVVDSDEVLGSAIADARGDWVVLPRRPLPPGTRELGIVARSSSGIESRSESVVVLVVPEPPDGAPDDAGEAAVSGPLAVLVPRGDEGVSRLMQGGEPAAGIAAPKSLSLDTVTYNAAGAIDIAGRALPGSAVTAYIGDQVIGAAWVTSEGGWRIAPEKIIDPGLYTLRVVQLGESGALVSRLETPFTVADVSRTAVAEGLVVVQPGNSLWRIARRIYGAGERHTLIFAANRDQIRDPELIYPGQILIVPEAVAG